MPPIAVKPIVLRDVLLKIGPTAEYQKHVSGVTLTPSSSSVSWTGLAPDDTFTFSTEPTWAYQLDYAQDWETEDSLSMFLYEHQGETLPMVFEPVNGGLGWGTDASIVPGSIGGQVNTVATSSVTGGCTKPVPIPAA